MEGDRFVLRSVTDEIMYEIMELSGQEYVDLYAGEVKAEQQEANANRITARLRRKQSSDRLTARPPLRRRRIRAGRTSLVARPRRP